MEQKRIETKNETKKKEERMNTSVRWGGGGWGWGRTGQARAIADNDALQLTAIGWADQSRNPKDREGADENEGGGGGGRDIRREAEIAWNESRLVNKLTFESTSLRVGSR